jgi:glutamine synthetase
MEALKEKVAAAEIDTVITAIPDMQGRLMGKRFHADFFLESAWKETWFRRRGRKPTCATRVAQTL